MPALSRIERICREDRDERALRVALLTELRAAVPCAAYAWLLTDPETGVGSSPLAEVPVPADLPTVIRLRYRTATNRWTDLPANAAVTSPEWAGQLAGYGVEDVVSTVFRDRHGCWGFLDLWRTGASFTPAEQALVGEFSRLVTPALRRSLAGAFEAGGPAPPDGPVVLTLSDDLTLVSQTPAADEALRALLPTEAGRAPVPAGAYNVAAQLLAREAGVDAHPAWARVHAGAGRWVTVRAARLVGSPAIAVSIEPTPPAERTALYARVAGLTEREGELLRHLVGGCDTHELARRLFLSEHTVQDHLKAIFAKTGANSRRVLIARATGT